MEESPAGERKKLSPGRHGLSREQVAASQRARLVAAMAEVAAEKGYTAVTVADVLKRAGVSRLTFYQHFSDKADCFGAAYDTATGALLEVVTGTLREETGRWESVERALGAYLDALAAEPVLARLFLVEAYAAGPEFLRRRVALQGSVVGAIADFLGIRTPLGLPACEAMVGAVVSMATNRVVQDDFDGLVALRAPLGLLVRGLARSLDEEEHI
ncbi:TetR/AcrR family transcriptional regulator [Actinomadura sp. WMMB 499]|uniref:TetR/AcrR family transcriptional regulator n=1 Tax=Actinomadura sp. WMMB 499 TaxID=1219491 RepID=UPI0012475703|nr:TetR/AcrR family transcriptional regulator [Actinomadura sp. WMMB 499]QFG25226.1 TetR/AcrR family transcriptional regulator [Actinomadura sp. WMMB 499]